MKNKMIIISFALVVVIIVVSLYTTFAYNDNNNGLTKGNADINLEYSTKDDNSQEVIINHGEEKYIDISLKNTYTSKVKYGIYYKMISPNKTPSGLNITKDDRSQGLLESTLNKDEEALVTIKISNDSKYDVKLEIGSLIGFEKGDISTLVSDNQVLIK